MPQRMSPPDAHSPNDPFDALRRDRDRWAQTAMEQAEYIRQLEDEVNYYKTQSKTMETSEAKTIINVQGDYIAEQNNDIHDCTIYASGISPVVNKESISESSSGAKELSSMNSYPFVVYPKLAELGTYTAEEFEAAYRQAAAQGAPKFAKFLKHYSGLGIFDFEGNEKKQIFEILKAFFPSEIKYGYTNFTVYF